MFWVVIPNPERFLQNSEKNDPHRLPSAANLTGNHNDNPSWKKREYSPSKSCNNHFSHTVNSKGIEP